MEFNIRNGPAVEKFSKNSTVFFPKTIAVPVKSEFTIGSLTVHGAAEGSFFTCSYGAAPGSNKAVLQESTCSGNLTGKLERIRTYEYVGVEGVRSMMLPSPFPPPAKGQKVTAKVSVVPGDFAPKVSDTAEICGFSKSTGDAFCLPGFDPNGDKQASNGYVDCLYQQSVGGGIGCAVGAVLGGLS
jgi:hypothetical protein